MKKAKSSLDNCFLQPEDEIGSGILLEDDLIAPLSWKCTIDWRAGVHLEMVRIYSQKMWMGSANGDVMADDDEKPLHKQHILYDYWIGRYPVTWWQYVQFATDRSIPMWKEDHPVVGVTWYEAQAFVKWLNEVCHEQLKEFEAG